MNPSIPIIAIGKTLFQKITELSLHNFLKYMIQYILSFDLGLLVFIVMGTFFNFVYAFFVQISFHVFSPFHTLEQSVNKIMTDVFFLNIKLFFSLLSSGFLALSSRSTGI